MAEDNIPPTPIGFRPPPPWAFGGAPAQNYYAPPAPPANDDELTRLRAENAHLKQRQQSGDDVESRLRGEYQDAIAQAMGRIKKLRTENKQVRAERDAAVAECDALRKRNAALESAAAEAKKTKPAARKPKARPPPPPPPPIIADAHPPASTRRAGGVRVATAAAPRRPPPELALDDGLDDDMDDVLASSSDDEGAADARCSVAAPPSARKPSRKEPVSQQSSDEGDFDAQFPARKEAKPPPRRRRAGAESSDDDEEADRPPPRKRPKPEREDAQAVVRQRLKLKSAADVADAHAYCRAVLAEDAAPEAALAKLALGAAFRDRRFAPVEKKQRDHQRRRHAKQGQATETPKQESRRVAAETRAAFSAWTASRLLIELLAWARGVDDGGRKAASCLLGLCRIDLHALCETNMFELLAKAVLSWEAFRYALDGAQRAELDAAEAFWAAKKRPTDEAAVGACGALFFSATSPRDARRLSCELLRRGVDRAAIIEQGWPAPEAVQEDTEWLAARGDGNDVARLLEKALDDGDLEKVAALDPSRLVEMCRDKIRDVPDMIARHASRAAAATSFQLINLDRSPDRLERLRKLALLHGLNVQRVQAVDGASDFVPECDVCRSWSEEARDVNTRYDGQREKRTKGPPPDLSPSERAIAASHIKLWRACSGDSMTFILEDDVVFEADCASTIKDLVNKVPIQSASLLLLGYFHREEKDLSLADEAALLDFKLPQYFWGAHAYGLTAPAAKVLLKRLPVDCPIDDFIAQAVMEGVLHCYAARAKVAKQRTQDTSLVVHSGRANPNVTHNRSKKISYDHCEDLGARVC